MSSSALDCAIVGAGAAGLSAARTLHDAGASFVVLEARDRIGGRIWSLRVPGLSMPVELGAEFLHGETPEIDEIAQSDGARLRAVDVAGRRWTSSRGKLRVVDDFWERLDRVMRRLDEEREPDRSFADTLRTLKGVAPSDRQLAKQYVEGFHAADATQISERALAEGGSPGDDVRQRRIGRILEGFDSIVQRLSAPLVDRIHMGSVVTAIRWRRGHVEIESRDHGGELRPAVTARTVIIAVPLGVLLAPSGSVGGILFDPPIPDRLRVAAQLRVGSVIRVALQTDEPFWADRRFGRRVGDERLDTLAFLQASSPAPFPVWWTPYPVRAPLIIGWRGGPAATELSTLTRDEIVAGAVDSLATLLGISNREVRRHVVAAYSHDWVNDPFSRGAYSYVGVGGIDAPAKLSRPEEGTLFFAGEHADKKGRNGTVHGALGSGKSTARAVLRRA